MLDDNWLGSGLAPFAARFTPAASSQIRAAIDLDVLSGDVGGARAAEKAHGCSNIFGKPAATGQRIDEGVMLRSGLTRRARKRHQAGCHRIDPDLVPGEFMRQRTGESDEPGLGSDHMRPSGGSGVRAQAADIDDYAGTGPLQLRQGRLYAVECSLDNNRCDGAPRFKGNFLERLLKAHGGVIDENIDPAE